MISMSDLIFLDRAQIEKREQEKKTWRLVYSFFELTCTCMIEKISDWVQSSWFLKMYLMKWKSDKKI